MLPSYSPLSAKGGPRRQIAWSRLVYEDLRQIARAYLRSERPDHMLLLQIGGPTQHRLARRGSDLFVRLTQKGILGGCLQDRKVPFNRSPQTRNVDGFVVVTQFVAQSANIGPRDPWAQDRGQGPALPQPR